jgi:hypothetical protein
VFSTKVNFQLFCEADLISVDGTLRITPPIFKQFFTLHIYRGSRCLACLYCLLDENNPLPVYLQDIQG